MLGDDDGATLPEDLGDLLHQPGLPNLLGPGGQPGRGGQYGVGDRWERVVELAFDVDGRLNEDDGLGMQR